LAKHIASCSVNSGIISLCTQFVSSSSVSSGESWGGSSCLSQVGCEGGIVTFAFIIDSTVTLRCTLFMIRSETSRGVVSVHSIWGARRLSRIRDVVITLLIGVYCCSTCSNQEPDVHLLSTESLASKEPFSMFSSFQFNSPPGGDRPTQSVMYVPLDTF